MPKSKSPSPLLPDSNEAHMGNRDLCSHCKTGGDLLCCDACPRSFHSYCVSPTPLSSDDTWTCPICECGPKVTHPDAFSFPLHVEDEPANGNRVALGRLMQTLEILAGGDARAFHEAVQIVVEVSNRGAQHDGRAVGLQMAAVVSALGDVLGDELVVEGLRLCEKSRGVLARGLGVMGGAQACFNPKCTEHAAGGFRVLRTHCLVCGQCNMDWETRLLLPPRELVSKLFMTKPVPATMLRKKGAKRAKQFEQAIPAAAALPVFQKIIDCSPELVSRKQKPAFDLATSEPIDDFATLATASASRGLEYFYAVATETKALAVHKGDILFLAYKMWIALRGTELEPRAKEICQSLGQKFVNSSFHAFDDEMDVEEILDTSEGVHVVVAMQAFKDNNAPGPVLKENVKNRFTNLEQMRRQIKTALSRYDLTELMGFNPSAGEVPLAPANHCSNCGATFSRYTTQRICTACRHGLIEKVDFGSLTDAVVWAFVFASIGIPIACQARPSDSGVSNAKDILLLLPQARKYRELDEMGEDFWKLQCYFVTHFIYVMSDWGSRDLRLELYFEEFEFIATNLVHALNLNDPEIVGEFLHCLRILKCRPENVRNFECCGVIGLTHVMSVSLRYLLDTEHDLGKLGMWTLKSSVTYGRYHAAFCGVVGLVPHISSKPPVPFVGHLSDVDPSFDICEAL